MNLAITDACIFIDLIELQLSSEFFRLPLEIHTSLDVFNELYSEQQEILKAYSSVGKLTIHILNSEEKAEIQDSIFPKSLSDNDKTVIYLAEKLNATVISSDKAVRNFAKSKSIDYHGMLWIFDEIIKSGLIEPALAIEKIHKLFNRNIIYLNNAELLNEKDIRIERWSIL